jgi:superfamily II DNA or RNA helicase
LIATRIWGTGVDIPCLELGIYAKGGKAEIDTAQGLGRIGRAWNDVAKVWCDIFDEYSNILEEHSKERLRIYQEQGVNINFVGFTDAKEKRLKGE